MIIVISRCSDMISIQNNIISFDIQGCQQCGACGVVCSKSAISFCDLENGTKNISIDQDKCVKCGRCVNVCPSHRILHDDAYLENLKETKYYLAYNQNEEIRRASSSGGVCRTLIIESLKNDIVDGVYSLRKLDKYPSAVGEFYTQEDIPDYDDIPNSVYHSIMACTELGKVHKVKRLMLVGTSCQLYALEKALKGKYDELIKICIFCKQQKTLASTKWLAKAMGVRLPSKQNISTCYRGDGWPGNLRVMEAQLPWNRAAGLPFGRRLWSVPGCNICGDPFGIEVGADLSLMDPWEIKKPNKLGETLVCVYTDNGLSMLESIQIIIKEEKTYHEIVPALGEFDVKCKRLLYPFYKGEKVEKEIEKAGKAEMKQRKQLEWMLESLPQMPFFFYRFLNKIYPKSRNSIIAKYESKCNYKTYTK